MRTLQVDQVRSYMESIQELQVIREELACSRLEIYHKQKESKTNTVDEVASSLEIWVDALCDQSEDCIHVL